MKVAIAIDSFKGSLNSIEAGLAAAEGAERACGAQCTVFPLADGGEGTMEALVSHGHGQYVRLTVAGPLGDPVEATYGILEGSGTAVLEMAASSGIALIPRQALNPAKTTTYGVGQIIRDAVKRGCTDFIIGIGGSATNDGGAGMLQALGFDLLRKDGTPIARGAEGLKELEKIQYDHVLDGLDKCSFRIACDVNNPLCGENGCSVIYGPQKGADQDLITRMDEWLEHFARLVQETCPNADPNFPGSGAAGGLGFAFMAFLKGKLEPGIQIVLKQIGIESAIRDADVVVTGEGRLDAQTVMGKAPSGVAELAKKYQKPVIAFSGIVSKDAYCCNEQGIDAFFPILRRITTLDEAMDRGNAKKNLAATAEQVFRLIARFDKRER